MLTAFSQRELIEQARDAGAMAYLVKPFARHELVPAIELAVSRFAERRALEDEVATLNDRLETRKIVDRAKGLLMTQQSDDRAGGVPLDPAHRHGPPDDDEGGGRGRGQRAGRARILTAKPGWSAARDAHDRVAVR